MANLNQVTWLTSTKVSCYSDACNLYVKCTFKLSSFPVLSGLFGAELDVDFRTFGSSTVEMSLVTFESPNFDNSESFESFEFCNMDESEKHLLRLTFTSLLDGSEIFRKKGKI